MSQKPMAPKPVSRTVIGTSVALASGLLYLVAYWGAFNINPFEFLSFDQLLRSAIYPLFAYVSVLAFYTIFFGVLATYDDSKEITLPLVR